MMGRRDAFSLDRDLTLTRGHLQLDGGLFNPFTDPALGSRGRKLMARREERNARAEGRAPHL
jgi:hypothetical protein